MNNTTDNECATMWIATDETAITFKCPRPKGDKETLAIAKATAGVTSEDDAFFAYMDVCAALGEYSMEWKAETNDRPNCGFVDFTSRFPKGTTIFVNSSLKNVAAMSKGIDGLAEGRIVPPGGTLTLEGGVATVATADGVVSDAAPTARDGDRLEDDHVTVICPYSYATEWDFGPAGKMRAMEVAFASTRIPKAKGAGLSAAFRIKKRFSGESEPRMETVFAKDGKLYAGTRSLREKVEASGRRILDPPPELEHDERAFAAAAKRARLDGARPTKSDVPGAEKAARIAVATEYGKCFAAGTTALEEADEPKYVALASSFAHSKPVATVGVVHSASELERMTSLFGVVAYEVFDMTRRDDATARMKEYSEWLSTEPTDVRLLPTIERA